jgi:cytochrome c biogenesis protein CcmG/thiol:disulfide interchange protein DsbE
MSADVQNGPATGARWSLWLPLALFALFVGVVAWGLLRPASRDIPSRFVGNALPAFNLPAGSDDRPALSNADFADGKPRLLNVFASWCIPCAAEAPQLDQLRRAGVDIYGVAVRDHKADLAGFFARNGNPYARIGADDRSVVQLAIGSSGVPETYVVDGKGVIRYQHIGDIRADDVPMILGKLKAAAE